MTIEEALAISDRPNDYTHNQQIIARITLAAGVRQALRMCETWLEREPECAGVRAIRDELRAS